MYMMNTKTVGVGLCLLTACILVSGQATPTIAPQQLKLLNGYTLKEEQGIDSFVGKISKPSGITLNYDVGPPGNNYTDEPRQSHDYLWYKEQTISGHRMQILLTKKKMLIISVPDSYTNFFGTVKKEEDIADALLMLATYPTAPALPADKQRP